MKSSKIRVALAQINTTVGALERNSELILSQIQEAEKAGADLVLVPELALSGYPPEDLVLKDSFLKACRASLEEIARQVGEVTAVVGFPDSEGGVFNAAAVLRDGRIHGIYHKICLPNYSVFDEKRTFQPGFTPMVFEMGGVKIGVNICEDIWLANGVTEYQALAGGASLICNISASPWYVGRLQEREAMLAARANSCKAHIAYVNLVGGQDELVFDGASLIFGPDGSLITRAHMFEEELVIADLDLPSRESVPQEIYTSEQFRLQKISIDAELKPQRNDVVPSISQPPEELGELLSALVLGTRDYVQKNGFRKAAIGLSGGVDSALTAAIAQMALGSENVVGVIMPSQFSSEGSVTDAERLAENLRIEAHTVGIESIVESYEKALAPIFRNTKSDVTEENLQARARGNILMALSNKFGWLVLTTGNKSETSVGYCTLYGDMAGGFAVLKDVLKTKAYELARYINRNGEIIPEDTITKPPSAELRPDQKDEDSLPPYDLLDQILTAYVERDKGASEIIAEGFDPETVREIIRLVDRNEYKRRQAPPGVKITPKAFGRDRRIPVTNHFTWVETSKGEA